MKPYSTLALATLVSISWGASATASPQDPIPEFRISGENRIVLRPSLSEVTRFLADIAVPAPLSTMVSGENPLPGVRRFSFEQDLLSVVDLGQVLAGLASETPDAWWSPTYINEGGHPMSPTKELFIRFREGVSNSEAIHWLQSHGHTVIKSDWNGLPRAYQITHTALHGGELLALSNALATEPKIQWAEPDWMFEAEHSLVPQPQSCADIPNDPLFPNQWELHNTGLGTALLDFDTNAVEGFFLTNTPFSVKVMVFDTGVQLDHPDFISPVGMDFTGQGTGGYPNYPSECHGTAVAGCIGAINNNFVGISSLGSGCQIVSARIGSGPSSGPGCESSFSSHGSYFVNALSWAQTLGVSITNNSNNLGFSWQPLEDKYNQTFWSNEMIHFASIGNSNTPTADYPASIPSVFAVGAAKMEGSRALFSQYGPQLEILAPGKSIESTDRTGAAGYAGGDYHTLNGTSFASPIVAGAAAMVMGSHLPLDPTTTWGVIKIGAVDMGVPGRDDDTGFGMLNVYGALAAWHTNLHDINMDSRNDDCQAIGTIFCAPGAPNNLGIPTAIRAVGDEVLSNNRNLAIEAGPMWTGGLGILLASQGQTFVAMPGGSAGNLCLGGVLPLYRLATGYPNIGSGLLRFQLDLNSSLIPWPASPGETWSFQVWHRDLIAGVATSNFSEAISITLN